MSVIWDKAVVRGGGLTAVVSERWGKAVVGGGGLMVVVSERWVRLW